MKRFYLSFLMALWLIPAVAFAGPIEKVAELIRQGNVHELSVFFANNVELTIFDEENTYPKAQAEAVLNKFFSENKPRKVTILHKVNSNSKYLFCVLVVNLDNNGVFRIGCTLKGDAANFTLIEMRIEKEKAK